MLRALAHRLSEHPLTFHWLRKLPELNYRATKARLRALLAEAAPARALDAGCGTGEFASLFAPQGYLGVDVHPGYVRLAARLNPRHTFLRADLCEWKGDGPVFDLALVNGVMHHHGDTSARELLAGVLQHTRPGGTVVVIEDVDVPEAGLAARWVHALDAGSFIRPPSEWMRIVGEFFPVERSETYTSGVCPYHLMVGRKP